MRSGELWNGVGSHALLLIGWGNLSNTSSDGH
jgi:hypothetical protein